MGRDRYGPATIFQLYVRTCLAHSNIAKARHSVSPETSRGSFMQWRELDLTRNGSGSTWHQARFEMASHGVIDVLLEFAQVDRLGRNAAVTRGFVPRRDKMSRISTSFDDNHNLIHTSNSTTVVPPMTYDQTSWYTSSLRVLQQNAKRRRYRGGAVRNFDTMKFKLGSQRIAEVFVDGCNYPPSLYCEFDKSSITGIRLPAAHPFHLVAFFRQRLCRSRRDTTVDGEFQAAVSAGKGSMVSRATTR